MYRAPEEAVEAFSVREQLVILLESTQESKESFEKHFYIIGFKFMRIKFRERRIFLNTIIAIKMVRIVPSEKRCFK